MCGEERIGAAFPRKPQRGAAPAAARGQPGAGLAPIKGAATHRDHDRTVRAAQVGNLGRELAQAVANGLRRGCPRKHDRSVERAVRFERCLLPVVIATFEIDRQADSMSAGAVVVQNRLRGQHADRIMLFQPSHGYLR
jgi:hypothetical protein